jgi:hypothetical protein
MMDMNYKPDKSRWKQGIELNNFDLNVEKILGWVCGLGLSLFRFFKYF